LPRDATSAKRNSLSYDWFFVLVRKVRAMTRPGISHPATDSTNDPNGPVAVAAPDLEKATRPTTIREFEKAMRALGYSQREATAIATRGYRAVDKTDDELKTPADLDALRALLNRNIELLKVTHEISPENHTPGVPGLCSGRSTRRFSDPT